MASSCFHGDSKKNVRSAYHQKRASDHQRLAALWDWLFGYVSMTTIYSYGFRDCIVVICIQHHLVYRLQRVISRQHSDLKPIRLASFKVESCLHWNYISKNEIQFLETSFLFGKSCQIHFNTNHCIFKSMTQCCNVSDFPQGQCVHLTSIRRHSSKPNRSNFSFVIPIAAIQCTFIFNRSEEQHDALHIFNQLLLQRLHHAVLITQPQKLSFTHQ